MKPERLSELLHRGQAFDRDLRGMPERRGVVTPDPWPAFAAKVGQWLADCVAHGRFLPTGTADRRALQGQVDRWTTRLRQADLPRDDVELLDTFDPAAGEPLDDGEFPYFGLDAVTAKERLFGDSETPRFLGRDDQTREYADHLGRPEHRALLIESESGGGKSSVAMAGVIPELQCRHVDHWLFAPRLTPGAQPMQALQQALAGTPGLDLPSPLQAPAMVAAALGDKRLLLFIDQLEELLTVCVDLQAQQQFSDWLVALAEAGPLRLLATMRSDHHDRLANSAACRGLYRLLTDNCSARLLPPLSFEQLRQVILRPAQVVGLRFVPASLVDRLANETANLPGGLPRLQFALRRLWSLRPPRDAAPGFPRLDLIDDEAFRLLPSVSEALGHVAEKLLVDLPENEQRAVQRLTLELTVLDEHSEAPLRRRRLQVELLVVLERAGLAAPPQALALIDRFVHAGLLVRTGVGDACQVEVAHESLFRHWDAFQAWIQSDLARGRLKQVRKIAQDAQEWQTHGRHPDYLRLTGEPLDEALAFDREGWLDEVSQRYCQACQAARQRAARMRRVVRVAGLSLVALIGVGGFLTWTRHTESQQAKEANQRKLLAANINLASLLGQLEPLDALDLAYTLEKNAGGNFVAPLAHAVDRLEGSSLLGTPDQGTDFTASGRALLQIVRTPQGALERIDIRPVDAAGKTWAQSIRLPADLAGQDPQAERLASVDVSPPLPGTQAGGHADRRLVVMSFLHPPGDGQRPAFYTRVTLHAIEARGSGDGARLLGEHRFAPAIQPHALSEAVFDAEAGTVTLNSLRYPLAVGEQPTSRLLVLRQGEGGGLHAQTADGPGGQAAVSAVAGTVALRVTGRLDGTVACPGRREDQRQAAADDSSVVALRMAWPWWVSLHRSGRVALGNCSQPKSGARVLYEGSARGANPQSLALVSDPAQHTLSFVAGRRLCQVRWQPGAWPASDGTVPCDATGVEADQIMPVVNAMTAVAYLALPDRQRPWLLRLGGTPLGPVRDGTSFVAAGLPVGQPPDSRLLGRPTGTVDGVDAVAGSQARAGIRSTRTGSTVWRSVGGGPDEDLSARLPDAGPGFQPQALVVNTRGTVALLGSAGELLLVPASGQAPRKVSARFKLECLALSPGGQRLLAGGGRGEHLQVLLDEAPAKPPAQSEGDRFGALMEACAVADNGLGVSGFQDGRIVVRMHRNDPAAAASESVVAPARRLLNPLVQYAFKGGIQALAVDADGRFVAALGKPGLRACGGATEGQQLRIWDMRQHSQMPVANTCLAGRPLAALGPLRQVGGAWQLDLLSVDGGRTVQATPYTCLGCGLDKVDLANRKSSALADKVLHFNPRALSADELKQRYGIEV